MSVVPSVRYVRVSGSMVAKPVNVRASGAWHAVQSLPGAPTGVGGTAGNASVNLSWTAPANTGHIPITGYTITRSPGSVTTTSTGTGTTKAITGLTNGTGYTFTVAATNAIGTGSASSASSTITPSSSVTGSMYISPASGTYQIGDTLSVTVRADSLTTLINAVQADLTYPTGTLQYVSTTVNSAVFTQTLQNTGGSGAVTLAVGILGNSTSGDQLVATVNFTVLAAGSPTVAIANTAAIYQTSDSANILNSTTDATYTTVSNVTGSMYLSPASGTYHVGDTISVAVHADSLTTLINAVQADLTYPTATLQYASATVNSAVFPQTLQNTGGSGAVTVAAGILTGSTSGDHLVVTVSFTVLATGSATVTVANTAAIYQTSDSADILNSRTDATFTIT